MINPQSTITSSSLTRLDKVGMCSLYVLANFQPGQRRQQVANKLPRAGPDGSGQMESRTAGS